MLNFLQYKYLSNKLHWLLLRLVALSLELEEKSAQYISLLVKDILKLPSTIVFTFKAWTSIFSERKILSA